MWIIVYHCPKCGCDHGRTEEFSHDHCFDDPEVKIEERICPACTPQPKK